MDKNSSGLSTYETVKAGMNIVNGDEYKEAFVGVSHAAADVLKKTLGPYGHTTVIDDGINRYSTKDGWSLVQRISFGDPLYNTMYDFIKKISFSLVTRVGDGTTTAIVAADAFIHEMMENEAFKKYRQRDLLNAMLDVKKVIIEKLYSEKYFHSIPDDGKYDAIYNIAYTSTNENAEIASMIQKIYKETMNPNIYVNVGPSKETSMAIDKGYRLDCGPKGLSAFANNDEREFTSKNGVFIFFIDHNVTYTDHWQILQDLMDYAITNGRQIMVFAPYFDTMVTDRIGSFTDSVVRQNKLPPLMMVQVPYSNSMQKNMFNDAAIIAGAQVFNTGCLDACLQAYLKKNRDGTDAPEATMLKDLNPNYMTPMDLIRDYCGISADITASDEFVMFNTYNTENPLYKNRLLEIKNTYEQVVVETADQITAVNKKLMEARLRYIRFYGVMGTINIGGSSEAEKQCLKDSVDDAVLACRSAYERGYVKGMNLATLGAIQDAIYDHSIDTEDKFMNQLYKTILKTLFKVFKIVARAVMDNKYPDANPDDNLWLRHTTNSDEIIQTAIDQNWGFNIVKDSFEKDELHVVNSVVADEEILNACVSILTYILTSNQLLSVNRTFDTKSQEQIVENKNRKNFRIAAEEIVKVLKENDMTLGFHTIFATAKSSPYQPNMTITPLVIGNDGTVIPNKDVKIPENPWSNMKMYTSSSDSAGIDPNSNQKD